MRSLSEAEGAIRSGAWLAYATPNLPGVTLYIGIPKGRQRPAMWLRESAHERVLAQFHGPMQAAAAVVMLDAIHENVNAVIDYYAAKNGDTTA